MVCEDTLKVRNLPKELTDEEKEDFMLHFGAQKVKVITSTSKLKSVVYAKFETKEIAKNVLNRLHQISVLNNRLFVQYAEHGIGQGKPKCKQVEDQDSRRAEFFNNFITKINAFNNSVNYNQPPPPHLKYSYPKANRATINNIAHALATVPRFYTQVLHLMNKMNLPPPFVIEDPSQIPARHLNVQELQKPSTNPNKNVQSSSESELESDNESAVKTNQVMPQKRTISQKKQVKRPKFIKPNIAEPHSSSKPPVKPENVFEKVNVTSQRKIELKVSGESLESKRKPDPEIVGRIGVTSNGGSSKDLPQEATEEPEQIENQNAFISDVELTTNQIPRKDLGVLPVFKDYHPGAPTCRLYIKNIAKTVELKDLEYIYNRYKLEEAENKPSQFDIRLMKEGRMKGQGFITFDNVELAQKALNETNGFILKEKPLVVVFARSAVPKK